MSSVQKKKEASDAMREFVCPGKAENGCAFPREFWAHFFKDFWEKRPAIIKQPFQSLPINAADAFQVMVKSASAYRAGYRMRAKGAPCIRFMKDNNWVLTDIDSYLPEPGDESIEAFIRRLEDRLNGQRFEFTFYDIQEHWPQLWLRLREFYSGLCDFTGMPVMPIEPSIFFGNHGKTAKGLHKDDSNNFVFPIEKKSIRFVNRELLADKGLEYKTLDYEGYSDDSIVLDGEPGDVIYIPADWFHVGETGQGLSLSLSVSFYNYYEPIAEVIEILSKVAARKIRQADRAKTLSFDSGRFRETAENLPVEMSAAVEALREAAQSAEFERELRLSQLKRVTGLDLIPPPPRAAESLTDDQIIHGDRKYPIAWVRLDGDRIACSANGHAFALNYRASLAELIDQLNSGESYRISGLIERFSGAIERPLLRSILEKLFSLRAISLAWESAGLVS